MPLTSGASKYTADSGLGGCSVGGDVGGTTGGTVGGGVGPAVRRADALSPAWRAVPTSSTSGFARLLRRSAVEASAAAARAGGGPSDMRRPKMYASPTATSSAKPPTIALV